MKKVTFPFNKTLEALKMANVAASGKVPSTIPALDKLGDYVEKQKTALEELARKVEQLLGRSVRDERL